MSNSNREGLLKRLTPAAVATILPASAIVVVLVCLLYGAACFVTGGRSPAAIGDPHAYKKHYDAANGRGTCLEVTPQYVLRGSEKGGLAAFDRETRLWREFTQRNTAGRLPADELRQISLGPAGRSLYYVTSKGGLARSSNNLKGWETLYPVQGCPVPLDQVRTVTILGERWLVMGTKSSGLCLYDTHARKWQTIGRRGTEDAPNGLSASRVTDLLYLEGPGGNGHVLLVGTTAGVDEFHVDIDDDEFPLTFSRTELAGKHAVCFDPTGCAPKGRRVLCRTGAGGVAWRTPQGDWQQIIGDSGFVATGQPHVALARLDREHNLLVVGTTDHGWDVYDAVRREWRNPAGRIGARIHDLLPVEGQWWVATDRGLQIYNPEGKDSEDIAEVSTPSGAPEFVASSSVVQLAVHGGTVYLRTAKGGLLAYRSPSTWDTLIPHQPCSDVSDGTVIGVSVHNDELWMAYANGQILVYEQDEHRLRHMEVGLPKDESQSRSLTCFAKSPRRVWCLVAGADGKPDELFCHGGSAWTKIGCGGSSITQISPLGNGLLAQTAKGTVWYVPDDLIAPQEFFAGGISQDLAEVPIAAAISDDGQTIYVAPRWPQTDPRLCVYRPRTRRWSEQKLPFRNAVREMHERGDVLYMVTDAGGLWHYDARASEPWRMLVSGQHLHAEDAEDPTIISAAELDDGSIYVAFRSGNVYQHSPTDGKWTRRVRAASNNADTLLDGALLWRAYQDGSLAVSERDGKDSSTLLASELGSQLGEVVLAADDATQHLWVVTTCGRVGAYNLATHRWNLTEQLGGEKPFSVLRWAIPEHAENRDFLWLTTNHGAVVFSASESGARKMREFPGMELRAADIADGCVYCVVSKQAAGAKGAQYLYCIATADDRSEPRCELPSIGRVDGINCVGDTIWVRTDDNHIHAYSPESGQWQDVAEAWGPVRMPSLRNAMATCLGWFPLAICILATLALVGSGVCYAISFVAYKLLRSLDLNSQHQKSGHSTSSINSRVEYLQDKEQRFHRRGRWLLLATCLMGVIWSASPLWPVNVVFFPSVAETEAENQMGPLRWRTDQYGAQLKIEGCDPSKPVFDQHGRFLFDVVEGLDKDQTATLLYTPVGIWECDPDTTGPPKTFADLKAAFRGSFNSSHLPERLLFEREEWSWHYSPGRDHTVTVRRSDGQGTPRSFAAGQWKDLAIQSMVVPDRTDRPMLLYTAAGIDELKETDEIVQRNPWVTTARHSDYAETRSFSSRLGGKDDGRPNRPRAKGTIYSENNLRWRIGEGGLVVELNGQKVPMSQRGQRYCWATEDIRDFIVGERSPEPTFWVSSIHGHEKYALDERGTLSILKNAAEEISPDFSRRRKPEAVRYAGTVWEHSGDSYVGSYEMPQAGAGTILDGRIRHDVIRDMFIQDGRLRLVTDVGFLVYRYDGQLVEVRRTLTDPDYADLSHKPHYYSFNGHQWSQSPENASSSILSIIRSDSPPTPTAFVKIADGSYKFDFDTISQLQLDRRLARLNSQNGILELTLGQTNSAFLSWGQGPVVPRPDNVTVFNLAKEVWRLEARRELDASHSSGKTPGILNKDAPSRKDICAVHLVEESDKFPWDHVDSIEVTGGNVRVRTREGIARVDQRGLDALPQARTQPEEDRQNSLKFDNFEDSWGKVVAVHEDEDCIWVACENRLVRILTGNSK